MNTKDIELTVPYVIRNMKIGGKWWSLKQIIPQKGPIKPYFRQSERY